MTGDLITVEVQGEVAILRLNRPPLNLIDFDLIDALLEGLRVAGADPAIRAIVLSSSTADVFSAGLDLKAVRGWSAAQTRRMLERLYTELLDVQRGVGKPTIAAVRGVVRGGGITLAASCDMCIAGTSADFAYSEILAGLLPAIHFIRLPKLIPQGEAFDLLFNGDSFDAGTAERIGLVRRSVENAETEQAAIHEASRLATRAPDALRLGRTAFREIADADLRSRLPAVIDAFVEAQQSANGQEGLSAFLEKRDPVWT